MVTPIVPCNGLVGAADVAYGPDGQLYFLSIDNYMVLRLEASGQQTVVVNGMNLYSGEARGPALAFNAAGDLFVAEAPAGSRPNRVSKITGGTATIFAPNLIGPSGLAFDGSGDLYISEGPAGTVARYSPDGTRHALADGLNQPQGLAYGPDELLYVAEYGGSRVSRISASVSTSCTSRLSREHPSLTANPIAFHKGFHSYLVFICHLGGLRSTSFHTIISPCCVLDTERTRRCSLTAKPNWRHSTPCWPAVVRSSPSSMAGGGWVRRR